MSSSKSKIEYRRFYNPDESHYNPDESHGNFKKPLLKSKRYKPLKQKSSSSSSLSSYEDEKSMVEKEALRDLQQAIRDRELAELRLEKKLRQEVIRLEKERKLKDQLNALQQEDNQQ